MIRKLLFQIQRKFEHKPQWWREHEDLLTPLLGEKDEPMN